MNSLRAYVFVFALFVVLAVPTFASAHTQPVTTPYWCGSYWSSWPCAQQSSYQNYSYSSPNYYYAASYPTYTDYNYPYSYNNYYPYQQQQPYNYSYYNYTAPANCPGGYYLYYGSCYPTTTYLYNSSRIYDPSYSYWYEY
jgi:hypothetical protein